MLEAEGIGKNLEQAIENALFELKAPREDVDIKILSEGGLFKKARVIVSISEDAIEKYEKRIEKRKEEETIVTLSVDDEKATEEDYHNAEEIKNAIKTEIVNKEVEKEINTKENDDEDEKTERIEVSMDAMEFLTGLLDKAGKSEYSIDVKEDEKYITYSVNGDNLGDLIGHRGECFYAISRLLTAVAGKTEKKILLDIGGYREKRVESLTALAKRTAERVARTSRYVKLDPMNPSDRRIIHTALQEDARVTTMSKGTEPHRCVIVFPTEQE